MKSTLQTVNRFARWNPAWGCCLFLVIGWLPISSLLAQGERTLSQIDGSRLSGDQDQQRPTPNLLPNQAELKKAESAKMLTRELSNLIPGKIEEGSAEQQPIAKIIEAFQSGDPKAVVELVEQLAKNPGYPPADVMLAALSYATNDQKSGQMLLERAAIKHPDDPAVFSAFARLATNTGRTTDARVLFEKVYALISKEGVDSKVKDFYMAQYLDGMIDISMAQAKLKDARELLVEQRKTLPSHPKVLMVSAELEFKENQIESCLGFLKTMKATYPKSRAPEAIIASWYERTGDSDNAEKWIRKAAEIYPKDPQVQLEFASWALNREDFPTATSAVKKADDVLSESPFSKNLKAKIAFAREAYAVAEAHYEALMVSQPMDSDVSNMYALCLTESNNPEKYNKALSIATRNLQTLPNNRVAIASLGYIQMRGGDLDQAKMAFAKATQIAGASPEIDYFIGRYLKETGDLEKAKQFIDRAVATKGLFLYRSAATKLLKEIESSQLPAPEK